jgi:hypothetical protein
VGREGGTIDERHSSNAQIGTHSFCEDFFEGQYEVDRGAAADADIEEGIDTANGYVVQDIVAQDSPYRILDPDTQDYCDASLAKEGGPIQDDLIGQLARGFHRLRKENLPVAYSWLARASAGAWATPAPPGGATGMSINSAVYLNVLDATSLDRTATTPGFVASVQHMGRGPTDEIRGQTVKCRVKVYASNANSTGQIRFIGPSHYPNNITTISSIGALDWYGDEFTYNYLNPAADDSMVGSDYEANKIDVLAMDSTSPEANVYIYAIVGLIEYE